MGSDVEEGKSFRIWELLGEDGAIRNRQFHRCTIEGPAVIIPSGTTMTGCRSVEGAEHLFWDVVNLGNPPTVTGFVFVDNCKFTDCTFMRIGMTAPEGHLDDLKRGWGLEP